jgi:hypothetical protein
MRFTHQRHGKNTLDAQGNLITNVGGDLLQTLRRNSFYTLVNGQAQPHIALSPRFEDFLRKS